MVSSPQINIFLNRKSVTYEYNKILIFRVNLYENQLLQFTYNRPIDITDTTPILNLKTEHYVFR